METVGIKTVIFCWDPSDLWLLGCGLFKDMQVTAASLLLAYAYIGILFFLERLFLSSSFSISNFILSFSVFAVGFPCIFSLSRGLIFLIKRGRHQFSFVSLVNCNYSGSFVPWFVMHFLTRSLRFVGLLWPWERDLEDLFMFLRDIGMIYANFVS